MLVLDRRTRSRRPARRRIGPGAEGLEARRLLVATPINVAAGVVFAIASPLPGLASSAGFTSSAQSLSTVTASVAPAPAAPTFGPTATGPSTTLSPLPNDSETAVATASEVARPTPGRSDRIQATVATPEIIPLPHVNLPDPAPVVPGPQIQAPPAAAFPAPVEPAASAPPTAPAPARPVEPAPAPEAAPEAPKPPMAFATWDAAMELVATDLPSEDAPDEPVHRAGGLLAAGVVLAAWGGWKYGSRPETRSRRRPILVLPEGR